MRRGVHLHVHSGFSFEDGASSVERLVAEAARLEMPALALTDHNGLYGAVRFVDACRRMGVQPLLGAEVDLEDGSHLTLLCETREGYSNLCQLLSLAHLNHPRGLPRVRLEWLDIYAKGLIALTGCRRSRLVHLLRAQRYQEAERWLKCLLHLFGRDGLFVELQDTLKPGDRWITARQIELAEHLALPVVATANVHYASPDAFPAHDLLTCARLDITVHEPHPLRAINDRNNLQDALSWDERYARCSQAVENTLRIAERCSKELLPTEADLFPCFATTEGEGAERMLMRLVREGAYRRYGQITDAVRRRLRYELHVICTLGYADYFLAVWDLIHFAEGQGIRHSARGSVSDCAVAYCLGITDVDPIRRGLPFERFLSIERSQKPDIDVDFDANRREEVFHYVRRRYGEEHVAMVCTFSTYRARSAVRLVGKALGLPPEMVDRLAKRIPWHCYADDIERSFSRAPELRQSGFTPAQIGRLLELCEGIASLPHHIGTHLGGILISRKCIAQVVPVQRSPMGRNVVQWDKDDVEPVGFIKLDLLSLRMLSAVQHAEEQVRRTVPHFRFCDIPYDDPSTFEMIRAGETIGTFQIESPAQRNLHVQLHSQCQMDIDVSVALIRPGPIRGDMVTPFIRRRNGEELVSYLHPDLEPILRHTCGVPVFQEQIILIATKLAGFTPGEADRLRKTMTHNRSKQEMESLGRLFVERAVHRGYSARLAEQVYQWIYSFAGYGFCEAHAASFGDIAYKTAFMLRYYPAEFLAALLSHQPMGYYPPNTLALEARRRGIRLLLPEVNRSGIACTVEGDAIRIGFCRVHGMSRTEMESVIESRRQRPFTSLADLCARTNLRRDTLENLILCGVFDEWHPNRRRWLIELSQALSVRDACRQLFHPDDLPPTPTDLPDLTPWEKFLQEWRILGISVDCHVMSHLREAFTCAGVMDSARFTQQRDGAGVCVGGLVVCPHRPPTRSGRRVLFFCLEDEFGLVDVVMFERVYQAYGHWVLTQPLVIVGGRVQRRGQGVNLMAEWAMPWSHFTGGSEARNTPRTLVDANGGNSYNKGVLRPRSSVDRAPVSGAGCGGSIPLGGATSLFPS